MTLSFDQQNLVAIYSSQASSRAGAILALEDMLPHLEADETELRSLCDDTIQKLKRMTDADYLALDLSPGI